MNGLHQQIEAKRKEIAASEATAADENASPAASHDAFEKLPQLRRQLDSLCFAAHDGENAASLTAELIAKLAESPVKTAELMLAIRDFETAGFRLRQHLGQKPD